MYVCVCMAVTERQIREAAEAGAHSLRDLRRDLGVTSECGCCATYAKKCLDEARQRQRKVAKASRLAA
jgi:bacterioferritin-associated ferredoxin